jgi:two-component system sensor histidine kinase VicK
MLSGLLKLEPEALNLEVLSSFIHTDEREYLQKQINDLLAGSFSGNSQFRLILPDGEKWIRVTPFVVKSGSQVIMGNVSDITAEIHNFQSVERYANKKNSILNILAHDLRGPLGVVNAITQILSRENSDTQLTARTTTISRIIKQCIDLITNLTNREFLETVEVELVTKRTDITVKVAEYIEELRRSEDPARRTFNFSSSHKHIYLHLDLAKFMQIMNNLMTNALKFTRENGTISLNIEDKIHSVLFTFSDDGIGIPDKLQGDIFDKFTNARRKGLHGEPSIGLGLSIVKTIVEWHKGKIWFESRENEGTTFYFEIPKELNITSSGF